MTNLKPALIAWALSVGAAFAGPRGLHCMTPRSLSPMCATRKMTAAAETWKIFAAK